jgi:hypothetical protein
VIGHTPRRVMTRWSRTSLPLSPSVDLLDMSAELRPEISDRLPPRLNVRSRPVSREKRRSPGTPEGRNPGSPGGCGRRRERSPTLRLIGRAGYGQHQGRRGRVILAEGLHRSLLTPVRSKCDLL